MKGRDVATDINMTIFSQTMTGAMQTSHLPFCYACPFMPNNIIKKLSNGSFSRNRQNTKRKLRMFLFFVVVVVVAFLNNIFSQYRDQCNRKPFSVSFIKSLKGIMLNGWILSSSKKALKWAGLSKHVSTWDYIYISFRKWNFMKIPHWKKKTMSTNDA